MNEHEHELYPNVKFVKGLPRQVLRCFEWGCEYKQLGKLLFTKNAYSLAWWNSSTRNKFFEGHYRLSICIPCGCITLQHYSGKPMDRQSRKSINKYAFIKPKYMGDCHYLYFHIPRWLGGLIPTRLAYRGIAYKRYPTWDKPGWEGETK
jgi:hypothetical protein